MVKMMINKIKQKYVNVATITKQNQAEARGTFTSTRERSKEVSDHDLPRNHRLSDEKMDGSFEPEFHTEEAPEDLNVDFVSVLSASRHSGGQYFQASAYKRIYEPGEYIVNEMGTTERTNGTQKIHTDQKLLQTILTNEDTK